MSFQISDREFHATLYRACGNSLLADVASDSYDGALDHRPRVLKRPGAIARSVNAHRAVAEALRTRDPEQAAAALKRHLDQVRRTTLKEWANSRAAVPHPPFTNPPPDEDQIRPRPHLRMEGQDQKTQFLDPLNIVK